MAALALTGWLSSFNPTSGTLFSKARTSQLLLQRHQLSVATIPKAVLDATFGFPTAAQVIPLEALPPLSSPLQPEVDLVDIAALGKPFDPPPAAVE